MSLPNFIVVGAAKAGTNSLCSDLSRHPGIFFSQPKEPEFFCRDEKYCLGLSWYKDIFSDADPSQIVGEGSTMYSNCTQFPYSMSRMRSVLPDVKLVYMIREPVGRAYSYWLQLLKTQKNTGIDMGVPLSFSEAIHDCHPIVDIGDYKLQIEHVLEFYPQSQLHVVVFEDYIQSRLLVLESLCPYIGIDAAPLRCLDPVWKNRSSDHFVAQARADLVERLKKVNALAYLRGKLPGPVESSILGVAAKMLAKRKYSPRPMDQQSQQVLAERYRHVRPWLEEFLQDSLDSWDQHREV